MNLNNTVKACLLLLSSKIVTVYNMLLNVYKSVDKVDALREAFNIFGL